MKTITFGQERRNGTHQVDAVDKDVMIQDFGERSSLSGLFHVPQRSFFDANHLQELYSPVSTSSCVVLLVRCSICCYALPLAPITITLGSLPLASLAAANTPDTYSARCFTVSKGEREGRGCPLLKERVSKKSECEN